MKNFDIKYIVIFGEDEVENLFNTKIIENNLNDVFVTDFTKIKSLIQFFTIFDADLLIVNKSSYKKYYEIIKQLKDELPIILIDNNFENKFFSKLPMIKNCILINDLMLINNELNK